MGVSGIFYIGTWLEYWGNDCMYSWYIPDVRGCQGLLGAIAHSDSTSASPFFEVFIACKVGQCVTECVSKQNPQSCILSNGQSLSGCLFLHLEQKIDKIGSFSSFFFTCNVSIWELSVLKRSVLKFSSRLPSSTLVALPKAYLETLERESLESFPVLPFLWNTF